MSRVTYESSPRRFLLALAVALIAGPALLLSGFFIILVLLSPFISSVPVDPVTVIARFGQFWVMAGRQLEFLAFLVSWYALGLVLYASGWLALHRQKLNGPLSAFMLGYVTWFAAYSFPALISELPQKLMLISYGALLALPGGGLTGLIIWRIAYRRSRSGMPQ
jgi:hypothetical protein